MSQARDTFLLAVARDAVSRAVSAAEGRPAPAPAPAAGTDPAELRSLMDSHRGVFVTLYRQGRLRGCIGSVEPTRPLRDLLPEMAAASAVRDPRFSELPLRCDELLGLEIEISLLSPLFEARVPDDLRVGVHGVHVTDGQYTGCFLPKVAEQMGWSAERFLSECCSGKAGLPADAWRRPGVRVRLFTVETIR